MRVISHNALYTPIRMAYTLSWTAPLSLSGVYILTIGSCFYTRE